MNPGITRTIFRWIHLIFSIPILGYIYSPFDKIPDYAAPTRYVFVPAMILSGLWMWKGHVVRRWCPKERQRTRLCEHHDKSNPFDKATPRTAQSMASPLLEEHEPS